MRIRHTLSLKIRMELGFADCDMNKMGATVLKPVVVWLDQHVAESFDLPSFFVVVKK